MESLRAARMPVKWPAPPSPDGFAGWYVNVCLHEDYGGHCLTVGPFPERFPDYAISIRLGDRKSFVSAEQTWQNHSPVDAVHPGGVVTKALDLAVETWAHQYASSTEEH
jgi:hypothetical protein